jgi:hypothetical protein
MHHIMLLIIIIVCYWCKQPCTVLPCACFIPVSQTYSQRQYSPALFVLQGLSKSKPFLSCTVTFMRGTLHVIVLTHYERIHVRCLKKLYVFQRKLD